ncbi:hypothetical protein [Allocoleopsis sp.]
MCNRQAAIFGSRLENTEAIALEFSIGIKLKNWESLRQRRDFLHKWQGYG